MSEEEVTEITYTPLSGEIELDDVFGQGAAALDLAAIFALDRKDVDGLVKIAREWTRLGSALAGIESLPEENKKKINFGFNKEIVEEEKDDKADSESDGQNDIQSEGRLRSYRIRSRRSGS